MRGFASWTRVPVVTTTSGRKGEPKGDEGDGARRMDRAGEGKRGREEGEREEWQGVGPSKKCKKKESFDEDGRAFRRKERGEQEFSLFPPNPNKSISLFRIDRTRTRR